MVSIEGKGVGSRKKLFDSFSVPLVNLQSTEATTDLNNLIASIVIDQVRRFSKRQHESRLLKVLTNEEITQGIRSGKITSGLSETAMQSVDLTKAIATATEAFTDGLFFVFIDSKQINTLEEPISLKEDSRIMFVRLTLIAGG